MTRLEVIGDDGRPSKLWLNFYNESNGSHHLGWNRIHNTISKYNGRIVFHGGSTMVSHLEFEDEKSAEWFLLRWS
jgi:hypothetical protein